MPTYTYEAKDRTGNAVSGLIEAGDERGAAASLREQGLWPTRFAQTHGGAATLGTPTLRPVVPQAAPTYNGGPTAYEAPQKIEAAPFLVTVPQTDLAMMYRQLATLINAGVPITQALSTLANQTRNGRLKGILNEAAMMVAGGYPLTKAMSLHQAVFTPFQIEMMRAGETSGLLETMCSRIAAYLEREVDIRRKLKMETLYPKIVLALAGCVLVLSRVPKGGNGGTHSAKVEIGGSVLGIGFLNLVGRAFPESVSADSARCGMSSRCSFPASAPWRENMRRPVSAAPSARCTRRASFCQRRWVFRRVPAGTELSPTNCRVASAR